VDKEGNIYTVSFPGLPKIYQDSAAVAADASLGVVSRYELATGKATKISSGDLFVMAAYSVTTNGKVIAWTMKRTGAGGLNEMTAEVTASQPNSKPYSPCSAASSTCDPTAMKYGYYLSQYMRWHYFDAAGGGALDLHAHLATWLPTAVSGGVLLTAGPGLFSYMATAGDNSFVQFTSTVGKTYIARCTPSSDAIACELAGEIAAASAVGVPPWDSTWGTVYGTNKYGFSYSLTEAKPSGKALFFQTVTRVSAAWTGISVGLTGTTFDEMNSKSVRTAYPQNSRMGLHTTRIDAVTGKVDIPTNGDTHYVDGVVNLPATEAGIWNTALYHYSIYNLLSAVK